MGETILFFIFGGTAIFSALAVVFNKNAVHSALFLLLNFGMLAGLYLLLNAQFIAAAQIIIYAGAIVVLFLFVVMLLGAELGEQVRTWLTWRNVVMIGLGLILLTVVGTLVFELAYPIRGAEHAVANARPEDVASLGQVELLGRALFTDFILPFEAASVLLLVGIVGVVVLGGRRLAGGKEGS
ncbi:MAG: NADH-quinone oxidoreductase subunit J [Anaerolineae bacterium]